LDRGPGSGDRLLFRPKCSRFKGSNAAFVSEVRNQTPQTKAGGAAEDIADGVSKHAG
jgi:hypothetical protein